MFVDLIATNRTRYFQSSITGKKDIIDEILSAIQNEGKFLKKEGGRWTAVGHEACRQKIAHAIQYQIRTEKSQDSETAAVIQIQKIAKAIIRSPQCQTAASSLQKIRALLSRPTEDENVATQLDSNDRSGFGRDGRFGQPLTNAIRLTNDGSYEQWLLQQSYDSWNTPAMAESSDAFENLKQSHAKISDLVDSHLQNSKQTAADHHIDFSHCSSDVAVDSFPLSCSKIEAPHQRRFTHPMRATNEMVDSSYHMEYTGGVGSQYVHHSTINPMMNDRVNHRRYTLDVSSSGISHGYWSRTNPAHLDHMYNNAHQHPSHNFGILLNDTSAPMHPAPFFNSLDVSGVSSLDGCDAFPEDVEVETIDTIATNTQSGVANAMNIKKHDAELLPSYPDSQFQSSLIDSSIEAYMMQTSPPAKQKVFNPLPTYTRPQDPPFDWNCRYSTMATMHPGTTVHDFPTTTDPCPLARLVRAASDGSICFEV